MTRMYKPDSYAEQTGFIRTHCRLCPRQLGCTILADAKPLDTTDPDYPFELVYDDLGEPSCTAFAAAVDPAADEAFPPVTAPPVGASAKAPRAGKAAKPAGKPGKPARDRVETDFHAGLGMTVTIRRSCGASGQTTHHINFELPGCAR